METKTKIKFFTIADYEEEENWLNKQSKKGWKLVSIMQPCIYKFEKCSQNDMIYKLDYKEDKINSEYIQMFKDYGWEYVGENVGWAYFRKEAKDVVNDNDAQIFSDDESKLNMIDRVLKTRMLPLTIVFLCIVIPNVIKVFNSIHYMDNINLFLRIFWIAIFLFYLFIVIHCSFKLYKKRKELE